MSGALQIDGDELPLGVVLRPLRKKQRQGRFLQLGDGVIGVLPEGCRPAERVWPEPRLPHSAPMTPPKHASPAPRLVP